MKCAEHMARPFKCLSKALCICMALSAIKALDELKELTLCFHACTEQWHQSRSHIHDMVTKWHETMYAVHYQQVTEQPKHDLLRWLQHVQEAESPIIVKADRGIKAMVIFLKFGQETKESTDAFIKVSAIQSAISTKEPFNFFFDKGICLCSSQFFSVFSWSCIRFDAINEACTWCCIFCLKFPQLWCIHCYLWTLWYTPWKNHCSWAWF